MSYFSYIRTNRISEGTSFSCDLEALQGSRNIMPENTQISVDLIEGSTGKYKLNYSFNFEEFNYFPKQKEYLRERLITQTLDLISECNIKGNTLLIETRWEGKPIGVDNYPHKQQVSYAQLNRKMLAVFFELEYFNYRSIEITY